MKVVVLDAASCEPIGSTKISFLNEDGKVLETFTTGSDASFVVAGQDGDSVEVSKPGFIPKRYGRTEVPSVVRLLEKHIIGYADKLSFFPGEKVRLYCHSTCDYTATLFRYGQRKQTIETIGQFGKQIQSVPDGYWQGRPLSWATTTDFAIPDGIRSGLYGIEIKNEENSFVIPLVINPSQPTKPKILVLASVNTWIMYNLYGGKSRYVNFENTRSRNQTTGSWLRKLIISVLPQLFLSWWSLRNNRLGKQPKWIYDPVPIAKPVTNAGLNGDGPNAPFTNHLAGGEWRFLAWLEKQAIEYDVLADWDIDEHPEVLDDYEMVFLSTHSEYWTSLMYSAIKQWHANGGHLVNLSGNTCYSEIERNANTIKLKNFFFHQGCADESTMLGVRWTPYDFATAAPYKKRIANHWIFEGIESDVFGMRSLNQHTEDEDFFYNQGRLQKRVLDGQGASGWETDKRTLTTPDDMQLIAKGMNSFGGAEMLWRPADEKRGSYFSVSSILFAGALLIDEACSRIILNVVKGVLDK